MAIIIKQNNLTFEISNADYTAKVIKSINTNGDIFIPAFIEHLSLEYKITRIEQNSFESNKNIKKVIFANDSEIESFGKECFAFSTIEYISIPKSVKILEELSFYSCNYLKRIEIPENSELESFDSDLINRSLVENIFISQNITEINESILKNNDKLKFITISPKNNHFANYNNDLLIGKSSYLFDQLVFVRRDAQKIQIPSFIK